jgi:hypothetical protein
MRDIQRMWLCGYVREETKLPGLIYGLHSGSRSYPVLSPIYAMHVQKAQKLLVRTINISPWQSSTNKKDGFDSLRCFNVDGKCVQPEYSLHAACPQTWDSSQERDHSSRSPIRPPWPGCDARMIGWGITD